MPPTKKSRSRSATLAAAAAAVPAKLAAAALPYLSLELRAGEVDSVNAGYGRELENALETINGHPLFHNMVGEEPRGLTDSAEETGCQCVLDNDLYQQAIAAGTSMAGGNLFWLDLRWSSTGVPLRLQVVRRLSNTAIAEPKPYLGALHVAVAQGYNPLNHRGPAAWS